MKTDAQIFVEKKLDGYVKAFQLFANLYVGMESSYSKLKNVRIQIQLITMGVLIAVSLKRIDKKLYQQFQLQILLDR